MKKTLAIFGVLGLSGVLIALMFAGVEKKEEAKAIQPAMEASYRAANNANLATLNAAVPKYQADKEGALPVTGEELAGTVLNSIPSEGFSGSNKIVSSYDGSGGWVYSGGKFSVNHPQVIPKQ